jgi:hypothetical protein
LQTVSGRNIQEVCTAVDSRKTWWADSPGSVSGITPAPQRGWVRPIARASRIPVQRIVVADYTVSGNTGGARMSRAGCAEGECNIGGKPCAAC